MTSSLTTTNKTPLALSKLHYPIEDGERSAYFGNALLYAYRNFFDTYLHGVSFIPEASFFCVLSQMPNIRQIRFNVDARKHDLRINPCLFRPSGTGKGGAFDATSDTAKACGLDFFPFSDFTDAVLAGRIIEEKQWDAQTKSMKMGNKLIPGLLDPLSKHNIIGSQEAEVVFDARKTDFLRNSLSYLQISMNTMGTADNVVSKPSSAGMHIMFNPSCSIYLVSYLPENLFNIITKRGFIQRMTVVPDDVTWEELETYAKYSIQRLGLPVNYEMDLSTIGDAMKIIDKTYEQRKYLDITPDARQALIHVVPMLFEPLRGIANYPRKKMSEFITRYQVLLYRFAWLHAITRLSTSVEVEDVAYSRTYTIGLWRKVISFIEDTVIEPRETQLKRGRDSAKIMQVYQNFVETHPMAKGIYPLPSFIRAVSDKSFGLGISQQSANDRIKRMIDDGIFERVPLSIDNKMLSRIDGIRMKNENAT